MQPWSVERLLARANPPSDALAGRTAPAKLLQKRRSGHCGGRPRFCMRSCYNEGALACAMELHTCWPGGSACHSAVVPGRDDLRCPVPFSRSNLSSRQQQWRWRHHDGSGPVCSGWQLDASSAMQRLGRRCGSSAAGQAAWRLSVRRRRRWAAAGSWIEDRVAARWRLGSMRAITHHDHPLRLLTTVIAWRGFCLSFCYYCV